jgi:hypothetical protein
MVGPIGTFRTNGVGAVRIGAAGSGTRAGAAMRGLAGRVASAFAQEFDLLGEGRSWRRADNDPYDVDGAARELTHDLGGGPIDEGRLARSLGAFVFESASLMGARPEARSLETIEGAIGDSEGEHGGAETVDHALRSIDRTTAMVAGRR